MSAIHCVSDGYQLTREKLRSAQLSDRLEVRTLEAARLFFFQYSGAFITKTAFEGWCKYCFDHFHEKLGYSLRVSAAWNGSSSHDRFACLRISLRAWAAVVESDKLQRRHDALVKDMYKSKQKVLRGHVTRLATSTRLVLEKVLKRTNFGGAGPVRIVFQAWARAPEEEKENQQKSMQQAYRNEVSFKMTSNLAERDSKAAMKATFEKWSSRSAAVRSLKRQRMSCSEKLVKISLAARDRLTRGSVFCSWAKLLLFQMQQEIHLNNFLLAKHQRLLVAEVLLAWSSHTSLNQQSMSWSEKLVKISISARRRRTLQSMFCPWATLAALNVREWYKARENNHAMSNLACRSLTWMGDHFDHAMIRMSLKIWALNAKSKKLTAQKRRRILQTVNRPLIQESVEIWARNTKLQKSATQKRGQTLKLVDIVANLGDQLSRALIAKSMETWACNAKIQKQFCAWSKKSNQKATENRGQTLKIVDIVGSRYHAHLIFKEWAHLVKIASKQDMHEVQMSKLKCKVQYRAMMQIVGHVSQADLVRCFETWTRNVRSEKRAKEKQFQTLRILFNAEKNVQVQCFFRDWAQLTTSAKRAREQEIVSEELKNLLSQRESILTKQKTLNEEIGQKKRLQRELGAFRSKSPSKDGTRSPSRASSKAHNKFQADTTDTTDGSPCRIPDEFFLVEVQRNESIGK